MIKIEIDRIENLSKRALRALSGMFAELADSEDTTVSIGSPLTINAPLYGNSQSAQPQSIKIDDFVDLVVEKVKLADWVDTSRLGVEAVSDKSDELDAFGTPWSKEVHSRTKSKDEYGGWKPRRGLSNDADEKNRFATTTFAPPPPVRTTLVSSDPIVPDERTFQNLITIVTRAIAEKRTHQTKIVEVLNKYGVPNLPALPTKPEKVIEVWDDILGVCGHG